MRFDSPHLARPGLLFVAVVLLSTLALASTPIPIVSGAGVGDSTLASTNETASSDATDASVAASSTATGPTAVLAFNRSFAEAGVPIRLDASESTSQTGIDHYEWSLGNGTTRTTTTATLTTTFDAIGRRNVSVTVVDDDGDTATDAAVLAVADTRAPTAVATANRTNVTRNDTIRFDATASTDNSRIVAYEWWFPNGELRNGSVVNASMERVGTNDVTLVVTDTAGSRDITTMAVTVPDHSSPEVDIELWDDTVEYGASTGLKEQSYGLGVSINDVEYDFDGDGDYQHDTLCVGCERIHATWLGTRTISVRAVDQSGNVGYGNATLTVVDTTAPTPEISTETERPTERPTERVVAGDPVTFDANASTDNHRIVEYRWDWNDDGTIDSTGSRVEHVFESTGTTTVTLVVVDPSGNEAIARTNLTVRDQPTTTTTSSATTRTTPDAASNDATSTNTATDAPSTSNGETDAMPAFGTSGTVLALAIVVALATWSSRP